MRRKRTSSSEAPAAGPQSRAALLRAEIATRSKNLKERAEELQSETQSRRDAEYEVRRIQRRQAELEDAASATAEAIGQIRSELVCASRRHRRVHGLLIRIRRLLRSRPVKHASALDVALERLGRAEEQFRVAVEPRPVRAGGDPSATRVKSPFASPNAAAAELETATAARTSYENALGFAPDDAFESERFDSARLLGAPDGQERRAVVIVQVQHGATNPRRLVASLASKTRERFHLVLIDESAHQEVTAQLAAFAAEHPAAEVIAPRTNGTSSLDERLIAHGSREVVVTLRSDTPVRHGWLERALAVAGEEDGLSIDGDALARTDQLPKDPGSQALSVSYVLSDDERSEDGATPSAFLHAAQLERFGVDADVCVPGGAYEGLAAGFGFKSPDRMIRGFRGRRDLGRLLRGRDVIVTTDAVMVPTLRGLTSGRHSRMLAAWHMQDCRPYPDASGVLTFADTHWLCAIGSRLHGISVEKVEPSIEDVLLPPRGARAGPSETLQVAAMLRPGDVARLPIATLLLLDRLKREFGDQVQTISFGCSDEEFARACEGWTPMVEHRGITDRSQILTMMRDADVFLDLSVHPALPRTGLEAMTTGCATVLSDVGGAKELAASGTEAVFVDPLEREAAYAALASLVTDRPRLRLMQAAGQGAAGRWPVANATLSHYALFDHHHALRTGRRAGRSRRRPAHAR